jgi:hypothetical protein
MYQSGRFAIPDAPQAASRPKRDPIVVRAITIVAARQPEDDWWALAPGVRSHAIYDEIRRLDRAWAAGLGVLEEAEEPDLSPQMA